MKGLYSSPLKVYLALFLVAIFGLWMGLGLPVSLFPNSSRPVVGVGLSYGGMGAEDFRSSYGGTIEASIRRVSDEHLKIEKTSADYSHSNVNYEIEFSWGDDPQEALKETELRIRSAIASFPKEVRDSLNVRTYNRNTGFFAASFYSETRSLDELYKDLEPKLTPRLSQISDAKDAVLWNPTHKKVIIELDPVRMASFQLFPRNIEQAIQQRTAGYSAGSIQIGPDNLPIEIKKPNGVVDDLAFLKIDSPSGKSIYLGDIAKIDYRVDGEDGRSMKTSGMPSLILFAAPRPGGNVKKMSEDILSMIAELKPQFSSDVKYRVLVDPSEFIRGAIQNVFHEVLIGSLLAVGILFLFIGSFKNVITAAIEIPLSMVLAFILMRMTGMNLNLISLGGLALASGMNVDASVVVMENIFRHFEKEGTPKDFTGKLNLIISAVKEVRLAVIASTLASLVVFAPLAFTSALSYAVLGDLAKTVIFSHGFSAFVALILVPTVRLHFLSKSKDLKNDIGHSPIESKLKKLEEIYKNSLEKFILSRKKQVLFLATVGSILAVLVVFVLPRLPKEVMGTPDTDWLILGINTEGNTLLRQMESTTEEVEMRLLKKFGDGIQYTFTQVMQPNSSTVMARLKNRADMKSFLKKFEEEFKDGATTHFWVNSWNPAELPLPDPPDLKITVEGGKPDARRDAAKSLQEALLEQKVLPRIHTSPSSERSKTIVLRPHLNSESSVSTADLADLIRVITQGKNIHFMNVDQTYAEITLKAENDLLKTSEDLASLPVGVDSKIVPLRALSEVKIEEQVSVLHRENGRELVTIIGNRPSSSEKTSDQAHLILAQQVTEKWKKNSVFPSVSVNIEDAQVEMNEAIRQLSVAVLLSILMIFVTLLFQLGNVKNSLIVLAAIPLGFIGVLFSLFVFQSTLSLNSVLGVILLNGIAVGNSIILVDFTETLFRAGASAREAVLGAAQKRLRPILITSLTTVLGMLPIALGMGQGGRVLQPLGIAVSGGLWVSMSLTLFLVPALQYRVLSNRAEAAASKEQDEGLVKGIILKRMIAQFRPRFRSPKPKEARPEYLS